MIQNFDITLEPGEARHLTFGSVDFVFCRLADYPVEFIVNQQTTTLESGGEYEHREGMFDRATLRNPNKNRPITVKLKMGTSRYRQMIIQGEVVVDPRVKLATGEYISDTRADHNVLVTMDYKREPAINAGSRTLIAPASKDAKTRINLVSHDNATGKNYVFFFDDFPDTWEVKEIDDTGVVRSAQGFKYVINGNDSNPRAMNVYNGVLHMIMVDGSTYEYATFDPFVGGEVTGAPGNIAPLLNAAGETDATDYPTSMYHDLDGNMYLVSGSGNHYQYDPAAGTMTQVPGAISERATQSGFAFLPGIGAVEFWEGATDRIYVYEGQFQSVNRIIYLPDSFDNNHVQAGLGMLETGELVALNGAAFATDSTSFDIYWLEPKSYAAGELHWGNAEEYCLGLSGLFNAALTHDTRTDAAVSVTFENGRAYVSGEVIRYTLDLLGIDTSGDYLDGITAFKALTKNSEINLSLGGRTFSSDEIADDFTDVELPQTVKITALNTLWSTRK